MRLRVFQQNPRKNARATNSNRRPPAFKMFLPSSLERTDQLLIQKTPLKITCKIDTHCDLLKTRSFLLIPIVQHRAAIPIITRFLCFFRKTSKPRTKKVLHISGFVNPKRNGNATPHKPSHRAVEKEVFDCFLLRTKATLCTPLPPSLH
jgi:hypothetical protein